MKRIAAVLLLSFFASCASQKDVDLLKWQIGQLKQQQEVQKKYYNLQIEKLKKDFQEKLSTSNFSVRSSQADIVSRIESLKIKVAELQGDLDLCQKEVGENKESYSHLKEDISSMDKEIQDIKGDVAKLKSFFGLSKKIPRKKETKGTKTKPVERKNKQVEGSKQKKYELSPKLLYNQGLKNYREKNYYAAAHLFSLFIEKFPKNSLIPNAYFWKGESYFKLGQYPKAILSYQVVLDKYKTSNKYPSAMLKEGIAFFRLGKKKAGEILLRDVIKNFPTTRQAKVAKKFLKNSK